MECEYIVNVKTTCPKQRMPIARRQNNETARFAVCTRAARDRDQRQYVENKSFLDTNQNSTFLWDVRNGVNKKIEITRIQP